MRTKTLFILLVGVFLGTGLVLGLSGCGGETSQPASVSEPIVAAPEAVAAVPDVEETVPSTAETTSPEDSTPATETVIEDPVEQPVLSWTRDAGGLNHCDRLSIYSDGRVEAVVCRATAIEPTVHSTLSGEQLEQVLAWAAEYASFTRRESEMTNAVRTTMLRGTGGPVPALEVKVEIAAFAATVFLGLTEED